MCVLIISLAFLQLEEIGREDVPVAQGASMSLTVLAMDEALSQRMFSVIGITSIIYINIEIERNIYF